MNYSVVFFEKTKQQFKNLDKRSCELIVEWIETKLQDCEDPRQYGMGLVSDASSQWKYRIGNCRLICEIKDNVIIVLSLEVGY